MEDKIHSNLPSDNVRLDGNWGDFINFFEWV